MSTELSSARVMLALYIEAEQAVLAGKELTKGGKTWKREDLAEIRKGRQEWERKIQLLSVSGVRRGPALAEF